MSNVTSPVRRVALVPAAGSGSRMGAALPKQYLTLLGRPLIAHTLRVLCRHALIDRVYVVLSPGDEEWARHDWSDLGPKLRPLECGGATRADSVTHGLCAMADELGPEDWVLVHDAARPCLSQDQLQALMTALEHDAVGGLLAVPVADTLKRAAPDQSIAATVPRDGLWQAQTPQMFRHGLLLRALLHTGSQGITDEASAVEALGLAPRLVASDMTNLKVTFPLDLHLAEMILHQREIDHD